MPDENTLFREKPFSYVLLDNTAEIRFRGDPINVISEKPYERLLKVIKMDNKSELQLFLMKSGGM